MKWSHNAPSSIHFFEWWMWRICLNKSSRWIFQEATQVASTESFVSIWSWVGIGWLLMSRSIVFNGGNLCLTPLLQIRRCLASERRMQQVQFGCWHARWCWGFRLSEACLIFTSDYSFKCNNCWSLFHIVISSIHPTFTTCLPPKTDPNVSQIHQSNGLFVSNEGVKMHPCLIPTYIQPSFFKRFQIPEAGGSCDVLCKYPYVGTPGEAQTEDVRWTWYWIWCMRVFYALPWGSHQFVKYSKYFFPPQF